MPNTKEIPLNEISVDPELQPRVKGLDADHVCALQDIIDICPYIRIVEKDSKYILIDGFHRLAAMQNLGLEKAMFEIVEVKDGEDLFALAYKFNNAHGAPLTLDDRRSYASKLLHTHPDWSDREQAFKAIAEAFDRTSENPQIIAREQLQSFSRVLKNYNISPEITFIGGEGERGKILQRRHIKAQFIEHIGKEAQNWEEQFTLGENPDYQSEYGAGKRDTLLKIAKHAIKTYGNRLSDQLGKSRKWLSLVKDNKQSLSLKNLNAIAFAAPVLEAQDRKREHVLAWIKEQKESDKIGLQNLAEQLGIKHKTNLINMLKEKGEKNWRKIPDEVYGRMEQLYDEAHKDDMASG